jgi:hypothetical protein
VRSRRVLLGIGGAALLVWCAAVSGYHRDSRGAVATWLISLAVVIAVDLSFWLGRHGMKHGWTLRPASHPWPRPGRGGSAHALAGTSPWLLLLVVAAAWDVLGIDTGTHEAHLTLSALAQAYRPLNATVLLVWILVGVGYGAARARSPVEVAAPPSRQEGGATFCASAALGSHGPRLALILPSSRPAGVAFWIAVLAAGVVTDLVARRTDGRVATAEEFVRFVSTSRVANVALVVAWTFAGYHLFAR